MSGLGLELGLGLGLGVGLGVGLEVGLDGRSPCPVLRFSHRLLRSTLGAAPLPSCMPTWLGLGLGLRLELGLGLGLDPSPAACPPGSGWG